MSDRACVVLAVAALAWALTARLVGPSDAWDQTQPKTLSYTTDMVTGGSPVLPQWGGEPATKPPLYNWLAAPFVSLAGVSSEPAHKLPSVLALLVAWATLGRLGPRLLGLQDRRVGWLAATMLPASYAFFKLGYLARPDMLLVLWVQLGWMAGTAMLVGSARRWPAAAFWTCVGLGALTKGPAVAPLVVWALLAAWTVGRAGGVPVRRWGWWWGVPWSLVLGGSWVAAAWRLDPEHVWVRLWQEEVLGRVTGTGPYGAEGGSIELITSAPDATWYWLSRFLPWCAATVAAAFTLWRRGGDGRRRWRSLGAEGAALQGAALMVVVVIAVFTLSAGKRADYVAGACPPAALLAAWWLLRGPTRPAERRPWLVPAVAAVTLAGLTVYNRLDLIAPQPGYGDAIGEFARRVQRRLAADPMPLVTWVIGETHLQPLIGHAAPDDGGAAVASAARRGRPFWLLAGRRPNETFEQWLADRPFRLRLVEVERSDAVPWTAADAYPVLLYRAEAPQ